jgi:hypothetical protein
MESDNLKKKYILTSEGLDYLSSSASTLVLFCFICLRDLHQSQIPFSFDFKEAEEHLGVPASKCFELIDSFEKHGFIQPFSPQPISIEIFSKPGLYSEKFDKEENKQ